MSNAIQPGYHAGIPFAEYQRAPGVSKSALDYLRKSPAHYRDYIEGRYSRTDSEPMQFGRLAHALILEHRADYVTCPYDSYRSAEAREWRDAQTKPVLTTSDATELDNVAAAVMRDDLAKSILAEPIVAGQVEVSMFAPIRFGGLVVKGRADAVGVDYFADLKFVRDASPEALSMAIYTYGWHRQAALYLRIAKIVGRPQQRFAFVAVEKEHPYRINVRWLHESAIDLGNVELDDDMQKLLKCNRSNKWPGYSGDSGEIETIDVPMWAHMRASQELEGVEMA